MSASQDTTPDADLDIEGHRLAANDNETVVEDELDAEGHRLASNDNETVIDDAAPERDPAVPGPATDSR